MFGLNKCVIYNYPNKGKKIAKPSWFMSKQSILINLAVLLHFICENKMRVEWYILYSNFLKMFDRMFHLVLVHKLSTFVVMDDLINLLSITPNIDSPHLHIDYC